MKNEKKTHTLSIQVIEDKLDHQIADVKVSFSGNPYLLASGMVYPMGKTGSQDKKYTELLEILAITILRQGAMLTAEKKAKAKKAKTKKATVKPKAKKK